MSGSLNRVTLIGNLGADPEIRMTQDGRPIANMSIATSETWTDKGSGEKRERTEWHRVVIFNEALAKVAEQYLRKGSKVYVDGQLRTRKWQDKDGIDRYSTEVTLMQFNSSLILLDRAEGGNRPPPADDPDSYGRQKARTSSQTPKDDGQRDQQYMKDLDDEIPF